MTASYTEPYVFVPLNILTAAQLNAIQNNIRYFRERIRYIEIEVVAPGTSWVTGDGKKYFHIPADLNAMNLVEVHAFCVTAGTTGVSTIQIANVTDSVDMLSTRITIDSGETGSNTAATPAVIDTTKDDVATNDVIRIDIDGISSTAPKGLVVTLGFSF